MAVVAHHVFTDRTHGDLAVSGDPAALRRRRHAITTTPWTWMHQVHGPTVVTVERPGAHAGAAADAAVTMVPGAALTVQTADCAPILLTGGGGLGVVHAGWQGLLAGVVEATVSALAALGAPPTAATLGPCIHHECYEFGADDLTLVAGRYGDAVRSRTAEGHLALDLQAAVTAACEGADLVVTDAGVCTACSADHWSHRARGDRQRQALVAWLAP